MVTTKNTIIFIVKNVFVLLTLFLSMSISASKKVTFFATADPQFGYTNTQADNRAKATMIDIAKLADKCTDCAKAYTIAGDLTMDERSKSIQYCGAYKSAKQYNIQILDGAGNHDGVNWSLFGNKCNSFSSLVNLTGNESLSLRGWKIVDYKKEAIDGGDCEFIASPKYFCKNKAAYYYTAVLASPGADKPSVYLVQLHNVMISDSSVGYLKDIQSKLNLGLLDNTVPILIVGHQFGPLSDSRYSMNRFEFQNILSTMNVAAILHGHYHCPGDRDDHCDYTENLPTDLIDHPGFGQYWNSHGARVPVVNVNAARNNIFWSISVSPDNNEISFKRFDRHFIGSIDNYTKGTFSSLMSQMAQSQHGSNTLVFNQPYKSSAALTCNYTNSAKSCVQQIIDGTLIPSDQGRRVFSDGFWGGWGAIKRCPKGEFVFGYRLRSEQAQGDGDDTGLNDIELYCGKNNDTGKKRIWSKYLTWGSFGQPRFCSGTNNPVVGFDIKIESKQGGDADDTAANDIDLYCKNSDMISANTNTNWGTWSKVYRCPNDQAVTGLITRVEDIQGDGDDTALNGIRLVCEPYSTN
ncbi:MAG: metallophosphoesterase [Gammaproteobacteria bacterium]|nr:metallophosphoesterase [Gammaproteobacteria bacterium]